MNLIPNLKLFIDTSKKTLEFLPSEIKKTIKEKTWLPLQLRQPLEKAVKFLLPKSPQSFAQEDIMRGVPADIAYQEGKRKSAEEAHRYGLIQTTTKEGEQFYIDPIMISGMKTVGPKAAKIVGKTRTAMAAKALAKRGVKEVEAFPLFKGFKDLTTKVLNKLKGKSTVSKQFISDLTNMPDLKQTERNVIRNVLDAYPIKPVSKVKGVTKTTNQIPVEEFAKKVHDELLPLKVKRLSSTGTKLSGETASEAIERQRGVMTKYESFVLPSEQRGNVANYSEHIWESPIRTSAGDIHWRTTSFTIGGEPAIRRMKVTGTPQNYFGHTRIEDMAIGKFPDEIVKGKIIVKPSQTRRVIELQSDLYQKGGLGKEATQPLEDLVGKYNNFLENKYKFKGYPSEWIDFRNAKMTAKEKKTLSLMSKARFEQEARDVLLKGDPKVAKSILFREQEMSKLQQYNDPTAHFRMIREEVKQAALDGKTKLQFPTGKTAMQVEGLGETTQWWGLRPDNIKVGKVISNQSPALTHPQNQWIITDVLGEGKFRAVPKKQYNLALHPQSIRLNDALRDEGYETLADLSKAKREKFIQDQVEAFTEQFDISGKVDTSNPIYRFYEKTVGKYLKNKFGATLITDPQGVSWWEVLIEKAIKDLPVEAFGVGALPFIPSLQKEEKNYNKENEPLFINK